MSGWRNRLDRKQALSRRAGHSSEGLAWFMGGLFALVVAGLGIGCLVADQLPIGSRMGILWIEGAKKNCFGYAFLSLAAALHIGFIWPRVPGLKRYWVAPLIISLGAAFVTFGLTLGW